MKDELVKLLRSSELAIQPVWTINNGQPEKLTQRRVFRAKTSPLIVLQQLERNVWKTLTVSIVPEQLIFLATLVEQQGHTKGNHRKVMRDDKWKEIYHVENRSLLYMDQGGARELKPSEPSVPCFNCGLVVPCRVIHIDHQRPQVGNPSEPVCKLFRAVGLTIGGPTGLKGKLAIDHLRSKVGGRIGISDCGRGPRYTLNEVGQIHYTLIRQVGKTATLEERCLNHVFNLRPLCSACNSPTLNLTYF